MRNVNLDIYGCYKDYCDGWRFRMKGGVIEVSNKRLKVCWREIMVPFDNFIYTVVRKGEGNENSEDNKYE